MRSLFALLLVTGCLAVNQDQGGNDSFIREGDVFIGSADDVRLLSQVIEVTGDLVIHGDPALSSLLLPRLGIIRGALVIADATPGNLSFLIRLPALGRIGRGLTVERADRPMALTLEELRSIGGPVTLTRATALEVTAPLLAGIEGDLRVEDSTAKLELPQLARVRGSVQVDGQDRRLGLQAPRLAEVSADLRLLGVTLDGDLRGLRAVGGEIVLAEVSFDPPAAVTLPALATVQLGFEIQHGRGLQELSLPALTKVGGPLRLVQNEGLRRLTVAGPVELGADLDLIGATAGLTVTMSQLGRMGGSLHLVDSADVSLRLPRLAEVVGTVRLQGAGVRELDLGALTTIGQHLELVGCKGPLGTVTLSRLRKVGATLKVDANPGLTALALPALATIGGVYGGIPLGSLLVTDNGPLATLSLPALHEVIQDVVVRGNAALDSAALADAASVARGKHEICGNRGGLPACVP
jgi:hypothetical protein